MSVDTASDPTPPVRLVPPGQPTGRRRLLIGAALLVTFVCGGVVGAMSAVYYQSSRGMRMGRMPDDPPRHLLSDLEWKLDLDAKQSEEVGKILREHFAELKALRDKHFPEIDASFEKMRTDVASLLDERQQSLWNEHFKSMRGRAFPPPPGHHRGRGPHHGGPPGDHDRRPGFDEHRGPRDGFGPPGFGEGVPQGDGPPDGRRFEKRMKKGPPEGGPRRMEKPFRDGDRPPPRDDSGDDHGPPHE